MLSCEKGYRGAIALSNIGRGGLVRYGGGGGCSFNMKVVGHYDQRWRAIWQLFRVCQWGLAGSTRSVSTSTALNRGVSLEEVLEAADWTRSSTFTRHYYRPDMGLAFGRAVLTAAQ